MAFDCRACAAQLPQKRWSHDVTTCPTPLTQKSFFATGALFTHRLQAHLLTDAALQLRREWIILIHQQHAQRAAPFHFRRQSTRLLHRCSLLLVLALVNSSFAF